MRQEKASSYSGNLDTLQITHSLALSLSLSLSPALQLNPLILPTSLKSL